MATSFYIAIIFTVLAGFGYIAICLIYLIRRVWPGRGKWYATSSYPSTALENNPQNAIDKRKEWRSSSPQKVGQWFRVDLGKPRMIASIDFEPDREWIEKPKEWRMMFYGEDRNVSLGRPIDGKNFISIKGNDIPKCIQYITVYVKEPMEDMPEGSNYAIRYGKHIFWTISLRIKEYRFRIGNKRFWIHEL